MLIDTHCHLNFEYDGKTVEELIQDAHQAGVQKLVTIGTDPASFIPIEKISESNASVFHTIGIHPHDTKLADPEVLADVEKRMSHPKCVGLGEIGLDYYYSHSDPAIQIARLKDQLAIAVKTKKPLVIHSRDAETELLKELKQYAANQSLGSNIGVIHCFTGTLPFARECIDLGFFISISGIITFKKSAALRDTVKQLPLDRLLVETDSPFLAPEPHRGKKCMPAMVVRTAEKIAEIFGVPLEEVAQKTTRNAEALFWRA
jgi:TatD DNase family protein